MVTQQIALQPGSLLRHETYRIERILGVGGFGITYLATDLSLDRYVAIKEFFPQEYCDRDGTTSHVTLGTQTNFEFISSLKMRFIKEARNIAKFDNPNIIKIHAAFEENNTAYYVMDYIEGITMHDMVKRYGPMTARRAIDFIIRVGEALEYVHLQRIMHLDIKPANIMIRIADETPILIDFGLSKQYDQHGHQTTTSMVGISHGFAPMEQYRDDGVSEFSPQTDIYSLAATLYFALSGEIPLQAPLLVEEELPFPELIPASLVEPIKRAMSPGRSRRQPTMAVFLSELRNAAMHIQPAPPVTQASPISQAPPTPIEPQVPIEPQIPQIPQTPQVPRVPIEPQVNRQPGPPTMDEPEHGFHQPYVSDKDAFEASPSVEMSYPQVEHTAPKSKRTLWIIGAIAVVAAIVAVIAALPESNNGSGDGVEDYTEEAISWTGEEGMTWQSALGECHYVGELDDYDLPNGKGRAVIEEGKYKGSIYDGDFVSGTMEGEAVYTCANGDVFEGTFKNNEYSEGTYRVKATGESFRGTFKNRQPAVGHWYDPSGNLIE